MYHFLVFTSFSPNKSPENVVGRYHLYGNDHFGL